MNKLSSNVLVHAIRDLTFNHVAEQPEKEITQLTTDSRKVEPNTLFVAIRGNSSDGHDFLSEVVKNGASVIVVEDILEEYKKSVEAKGIIVCRVGNTRLAYTRLCFEWWGNPQKKIKTAAITGTNGKTTVATLLWQLLGAANIQADLLSTAGKIISGKHIPSQLTTSDPFELAKDFAESVAHGTQVLVMEASSHALDQHRVAGIDFDVAAFTNLSRDHLDYHGTMEAYANAKSILFKGLKSHALAVINVDDAYASLMAKTAAKKCMISFEVSHPNFEVDVVCEIEELTPKGMKLNMNGRKLHTTLTGAFNAKNLAMAWQMAVGLGAEQALMEVAVPGLRAASGRMEHVSLENSDILPLVIVDYAHTPDAMDNTLAAVHQIKKEGQRLVVVFGCGGDRDRGKRPLMAKIAFKFADQILLTNDNPRTEDPGQIFDDIIMGLTADAKFRIIEKRDEAIHTAIFGAEEQDIVIILGKGHETYQEINGIRTHFDDREVAKKALEERSAGLKNVKEVGDR